MSCWCFPTLVLTQQLDHVHDRISWSCGHLPLHILYLLTCFDTLPVYTESISSWDQNGLVFLVFFRWSLCPFSRLYGNKIYWPRGNRALLSFTTYWKPVPQRDYTNSTNNECTVYGYTICYQGFLHGSEAANFHGHWAVKGDYIFLPRG